MYIIDTYLDKDRLPVLEKKELCRETQTLNSPDMTFDFLNRYFRLKDRTEEYIYLLAFDKKCHLIGVFELSHGTVDSSLKMDMQVMTKIKDAGEILSVPLLDFIICGECYYSAQKEGCL